MNIVIRSEDLVVEVNETGGQVETFAYRVGHEDQVVKGSLQLGMYYVFDELNGAAQSIVAGLRGQVPV